MSFCRDDGRCEICDPPIRRDPDEERDGAAIDLTSLKAAKHIDCDCSDCLPWTY